MKKLFYIAAVSIILVSCEKNDVFGRAELEVTLEVAEYQGSVFSPDSVTIYLRVPGETEYLYERVTDDDGKVVFSVLKEGATYEVFSSYEKDGIPYEQTSTIEIKDSETKGDLRLLPQTDEFNVLSLKCVDDQGAGIPQVDLCLFLSKALADSADCEYSTYTQTTNSFGNSNFWNLPDAKYYLGILDTIGGYPVDYLDSFVVNGASNISEELEIIP